MAKTLFSDGNPLQGILGTIVNATFLNKIFNHRHDGLDQDGSAPLDYAVDQGAANTYVVALTPALTAHIEGFPIHFKAANANTGASTLTVNGLPAKPITMPDGSALTGGLIKVGQIVTVIFTGTSYMIISATSMSPFPTGTVVYSCLTTPIPSGFLKANGAAINRSTYSALFALIGTYYGLGDGATTFNLPDLRGEFIRGWDDGRGVDSGRTIGSPQAQQIGNHNHEVGVTTYSGGASYGMVANTGSVSFGVSQTESRPRNIALLACIKY